MLVEQALAEGRTDPRYRGNLAEPDFEGALSRGELVIDRREFTGRAGHGQYVPRATSQYLS